MNTVAIYRCVFADYDILLDELVVLPNVDYYLFTDDPDLDVYPYRTIVIKDFLDNPSIANRSFKLNIPEELKCYDVTIYMDGNIGVLANIESLIDDFLFSNADIGLFTHPNHNSLEDEIELCMTNQKSSETALRSEVKFYSDLNTPKLEKFSDNSILFRKKHTEKFSAAMNEWLELVKEFSGRDQLSLPFIRYKYNLKEHFFDFSPRTRRNKYFIVFPHNIKQHAASNFEIFKFKSKFILKKVFRYCLYIKNLRRI